MARHMTILSIVNRGLVACLVIARVRRSGAFALAGGQRRSPQPMPSGRGAAPFEVFQALIQVGVHIGVAYGRSNALLI